MAANDPIGIFDSGVGGVSVLREIRRALPHEHLVYVADSGYAPYGEQTTDVIIARSEAIVGFLLGRRCKAIVVACNTATGVAIETLRQQHDIPIIAIEPALKPAAATTRSGVVGVLGTAHTLSSPKFLHLADTYAANVRVLLQPCPGFVEQVEAGALNTTATRDLAERYVRPLITEGADTLVLGCTHYPFLRELIQTVAGTDVTLIDPAVAVARHLARRLESATLLSARQESGDEEFWTSGDPAAVGSVLTQLWGRQVEVHPLQA